LGCVADGCASDLRHPVVKQLALPGNHPHNCTHPTTRQSAKEDAVRAAKEAAISAEAAAEEGKHRARGFGARLWGRGEVSCGVCVGGVVGSG